MAEKYFVQRKKKITKIIALMFRRHELEKLHSNTEPYRSETKTKL